MDFVRAVIASVIRALCIGLILYAVAAYSPNALAQTGTCPPTDSPATRPCDQGQAKSAATSWSGAAAKCQAITGPGHPYNVIAPTHSQNSAQDGYYVANAQCMYNGSVASTVSSFPTVYYYGSTCLTGQYRSGLSDSFNYIGSLPECLDGCKVTYGPRVETTFNGSTAISGTGRAYTGDVCPTTSPPSPTKQEATQPPEDVCSPAGNGQTMCVKPSGEHCSTSARGNQFCWSPNETGTKTNEEAAQKKDVTGKPVTPPNVSIPNDKEWNREEGHQATACVNSTCTTYNISNFTQVPRGSGNDGGDGTEEESSEGAEDGEEHDGYGNGAVNCDVPPQCSSKSDAIGCAMLKQHFNLTCREGDDDYSGVPDGIADADIEKPVSGIFQAGEGGNGGEYGDVDMSGWAGTGACPVVLSFTIPRFGTYTMDGEWICHVLDVLRALINVLAGIHAGFIIASGFRKGG